MEIFEGNGTETDKILLRSEVVKERPVSPLFLVENSRFPSACKTEASLTLLIGIKTKLAVAD